MSKKVGLEIKSDGCKGLYDKWPNQCCCKCKHQFKIYKHPWNKGKAKGSISELFGYGCLAPEERTIIFFDKEHGLCETFRKL